MTEGKNKENHVEFKDINYGEFLKTKFELAGSNCT